MSMSLARAKCDAESRLSEEKKIADRRRNIIVLSSRFFMDLGYVETVRQIQADTNINLDKVDAADNVDLTTILTEYEDFYEMRFGKKPKITRKGNGCGNDVADARSGGGVKKDLERKISLPKIVGAEGQSQGRADSRSESSPPAGSGGSKRRERSQQRSSAQNREDSVPRREKPPLPPGTEGSDVSSVPVGKDAGAGGGGGGGLNDLIVGQSVAKSSAAPVAKGGAKVDDGSEQGGNDFFDNQLLKALPCFGGDKEYRDLAISISRDILTRNPGVTWDSIVGLNNAKALLKEAVVMPLKYPQFFTGLLAPWKGVLLFGPPGTGKTLLAKAVATECETTFFNISASTVVSKWRGDSEKLIRVLFDLARHHQPSTIFIDELDSLMGARGGGDGEHEGSRRMKTELLIQMDGLLRDSKDQVFLLAASNLPWDLDSAMLRRLEKRILVNLPTAEARAAMIRSHLPEGFSETLDYARLAGLTEEWSGSDIRLLCKEAAMNPLRRLMAEIERQEAAAASAAASKGTNRQRAADKASALMSAVNVEALTMGPVLESDVSRALERVHRAPSAHLDKYEAWQQQFGAA
eukprot:TRINITY_DN61319_c0_g1_i1.p1 TRINITY_DN61319_c0_g1~~TRINITY_DN61319_c0_g1_i1.p1  ORF type:complete len:579 (-),score=101.25 TRINITY_DN61319_c0_g1_i1:54-1790(-)